MAATPLIYSNRPEQNNHYDSVYLLNPKSQALDTVRAVLTTKRFNSHYSGFIYKIEKGDGAHMTLQITVQIPDLEDDYLTHEARLRDGFPHPNTYSIWYCDFRHSLLADDQWQRQPHSHLDPYGFVMELFDASFTAQEAAEIFVRVDAERYSRQMEAMEVGA